MNVSPAVGGFLKGLAIVVALAIAGFVSDATHLTGVIGPQWAGLLAVIAASLVSSLESSVKAKSNGEKGLFGAVTIKK